MAEALLHARSPATPRAAREGETLFSRPRRLIADGAPGGAPSYVPITPRLLRGIERCIDLRDLRRLDLLVRGAAVAARLAAEVEVQIREAVAAVRADLLERRQQLLLRLRPGVRADRDGR